MTRALEQFSRLADMTAERGMGLMIEFAPPHGIGTLRQALAMIAALDRPHVRLVIDAMHVFRSGATLRDLAALDPALIGYIQLCDVPMAPTSDDYFQEACFERRLPGDGELPLRDMLALLPDNIPIGLEIPCRSLAGSGAGLPRQVARMVEAASRLLGSAQGRPGGTLENQGRA